MAQIKLTEWEWNILNELNETACKCWFWDQSHYVGRREPSMRISRETLARLYEDFNQANLVKGVKLGKLAKNVIFDLYDLFVKHEIMTDAGRDALAAAIKTLP